MFEISRTGAIVAENEREGKEEDVGNALFLWFEQKLGQGARLSGPLLKQKACDFARTQGTDYTPSVYLTQLTFLNYGI